MSNSSPSSPVRIGFVGCGNHASQNLYPCLGPAGADLVAVADLSAERRKHARLQWRPSRLYDSGEALVRAGGIDALFVVGPAHLHEEMINLAIEFRLPIFAEKPPAITAAGARALALKAREAGVLVMTGFMKRFASAYARALEASAQPEFGGRRHLMMRYSHGMRRPLAESLPVMGIHALDLVRAFMGDPAHVQVRRAVIGQSENVSLQMSFASGGMATVVLDSSAPAVMERLELVGDGHLITVDEVAHYWSYDSSPDGIWTIPAARSVTPNFALQTAETSSAMVQGYAGEVAEFIAAVGQGRVLAGPTLDDGAAALELCERIAATTDGGSFNYSL